MCLTVLLYPTNFFTTDIVRLRAHSISDQDKENQDTGFTFSDHYLQNGPSDKQNFGINKGLVQGPLDRMQTRLQ